MFNFLDCEKINGTLEVYTRGENFSVKIKYKQGWACKKYKNKEGMKTKEDYPAAEKSWWKKTKAPLHLLHSQALEVQ